MSTSGEKRGSPGEAACHLPTVRPPGERPVQEPTVSSYSASHRSAHDTPRNASKSKGKENVR